MPEKSILTVADVERLENTSFASALAAVHGDFGGGMEAYQTTPLLPDLTIVEIGTEQCSEQNCSDGVCVTFGGDCWSVDGDCDSNQGHCPSIGQCTGIGICFVSNCCSITAPCCQTGSDDCGETDDGCDVGGILELPTGAGDVARGVASASSLHLLDAVRRD